MYAYDKGDKLHSITRNGWKWRVYAYNVFWEATSITEGSNVTTFNWNNDGRVVGMDLPGTANDATFRYNEFGTRIDRTVGASTEVWKRSGAGITASVLNDGTATFTPGISSRVGSTSTFTHAGLKNTSAQSEGPAITGTKTYDAFGLETATTGTWKTAFGYAGNFGYQKTDAGMKLLGHRYYDPETGRFLSRDPIKDGRNWYAYGAGLASPSNIADPTGLEFLSGASDFFGGWGDTLTNCGIISLATGKPATQLVQEALGVRDQVNTQSGNYAGGVATGTVHGSLAGPPVTGAARGFKVIRSGYLDGVFTQPVPQGATIIGRKMDRVKAAGMDLRGWTIADEIGDSAWTLKRNFKWMLEKVWDGVTMVDIGHGGEGFGTRVNGKPKLSAYVMERAVTFFFGGRR